MKVKEVAIPGLILVEPSVFEDQRGYFFESYNEERFKEHGIGYRFVQDNQSRSVKGVIRGLHYQIEPHAQTKLLRVIEGIVLDVAVDLRLNSPAYGKWYAVELSAQNRRQLLVPKGFAHGFTVLSDYATVFYKCDNFYNPGYERGIRFDDEFLGIDWKVPSGEAVISEKDNRLPSFHEAEKNFVFGSGG